MWQRESELVSEDVYRYRVLQGDTVLGFETVAGLWQTPPFAGWFSEVLESSSFDAYFWECRPVTAFNAGDPFEFVLVRAPALSAVTAEPHAFADQFANENGPDVIAFPNLGGDATLVAPKPAGPTDAYPHLAAFVRSASREQQHCLWREVGKAVTESIGTEPLWVSTSGLGVYWLHVRLDSRPKYYQFGDYRNRSYLPSS